MAESIVRLMALDKKVPNNVGHYLYRGLAIDGRFKVPTLTGNVLPFSFKPFNEIYVSEALARLEGVFKASITRQAENIA